MNGRGRGRRQPGRHLVAIQATTAPARGPARAGSWCGGSEAAVRPGWKRDYLLKVDGWAKDRDPNTAFSGSVEPLPFHGMSVYPYPAGESFPKDAGHEKWRKEYNTRPALRLVRPLSD